MLERMPIREVHSAPVCSRGKILVVDDEPFIVELLKDLFEDRYDVVESGDGIEARHLFEENHASLLAVISDLVLPGLNGRDLIRWIRAQSPDLTIVAISGSPADEIELAELRVTLLKKPFRLFELEQVLQRSRITFSPAMDGR